MFFLHNYVLASLDTTSIRVNWPQRFLTVLPSGTRQWANLMVCNRSWHLPGNPKLMWHPARGIKEWGCLDLSMDSLHLNYPLVLFGFEGSALTLPVFFSPTIIMLFHCSSTMTKDHFLLISYDPCVSMCL